MKKVIFSLAVFTLLRLKASHKTHLSTATPADNPNAGEFSFTERNL
jgi:hypothetical protein